jgi:hypothetical protein
MVEQAGRIVKIETCGDVAVATDETGKQFVSAAGRWDWKPLDEPPPSAAPPKPKRDRRGGRPI